MASGSIQAPSHNCILIRGSLARQRRSGSAAAARCCWLTRWRSSQQAHNPAGNRPVVILEATPRHCVLLWLLFTRRKAHGVGFLQECREKAPAAGTPAQGPGEGVAPGQGLSTQPAPVPPLLWQWGRTADGAHGLGALCSPSELQGLGHTPKS